MCHDSSAMGRSSIKAVIWTWPGGSEQNAGKLTISFKAKFQGSDLWNQGKWLMLSTHRKKADEQLFPKVRCHSSNSIKQSSTRWLRVTLFLMLGKLPFHPPHALMPQPLNKEGLSPERICHYKQGANWERSNLRKALIGSILMIILQRRTYYTKRALEVAVRAYLALRSLGDVL